MLEDKDIKQAKKLFKEWDNIHAWKKPSTEFIEHCRNKAKDSLNLAIYLLDKLENTKELEDNETVLSRNCYTSRNYYTLNSLHTSLGVL